MNSIIEFDFFSLVNNQNKYFYFILWFPKLSSFPNCSLVQISSQFVSSQLIRSNWYPIDSDEYADCHPNGMCVCSAESMFALTNTFLHVTHTHTHTQNQWKCSKWFAPNVWHMRRVLPLNKFDFPIESRSNYWILCVHTYVSILNVSRKDGTKRRKAMQATKAKIILFWVTKYAMKFDRSEWQPISGICLMKIHLRYR